jgi:hypothetical protein
METGYAVPLGRIRRSETRVIPVITLKISSCTWATLRCRRAVCLTNTSERSPVRAKDRSSEDLAIGDETVGPVNQALGGCQGTPRQVKPEYES